MIDNKKQISITEHIIRQLHSLVLYSSQKDIAGTYRNGDVQISGSTHTPPSHILLDQEMKNLIAWYKKNQKELHTVEKATIFHYKFVAIHPFWDGNGRLGRLLMNILLLQKTFF